MYGKKKNEELDKYSSPILRLQPAKTFISGFPWLHHIWSTLSLWVIPVRLEASGGSIWLGPGFWKSEHPSIFDEDADLSFICMLSPIPTLERVLRSPEVQCPYKLFGFSPSNIIPCILCWWVKKNKKQKNYNEEFWMTEGLKSPKVTHGNLR